MGNISIAEKYNIVKTSEIKNPETTIVVPGYNCDSTIRRAVLSGLTQDTQFRYNLVLVDNGNKVQLRSQLEDLIEDPRITLIEEDNPGLPKTLNLGFLISECNYCIQLDADDELLPNAIEVFTGRLKSNPKLSYLYGDCFWVGSLPSEEWDWEKFSGADPKKLVNIWRKPEFDSKRTLFENYLGQPKAFPKSAFLDVGGFDAGLPFAEDWDFILKMQEVGDIEHVPIPLLKYHYLPTGMTASYKLQIKSDCRKKILTSALIRRGLTRDDIPSELSEKLNDDYIWAS